MSEIVSRHWYSVAQQVILSVAIGGVEESFTHFIGEGNLFAAGTVT